MSTARRTRYGPLLLVIIMAFGLTACDPMWPASGPPGSVDVTVSLNRDGGATITVLFAPPGRSETELRRLGNLVARAILPGPYRLRIDPNDHGYPYVVVHAGNVYRPGRVIQYTLDTRALCTALFTERVPQLKVALAWPAVPAQVHAQPAASAVFSDLVSWHNVTPAGTPPSATLVMRPDSPTGWYWSFRAAVTALSGLALVMGLVWWRRTAISTTLTLLPLPLGAGLYAVVLTNDNPARSDDLQVAGQSSYRVIALTVAELGEAPIMLAAIVLLVVRLVLRIRAADAAKSR